MRSGFRLVASSSSSSSSLSRCDGIIDVDAFARKRPLHHLSSLLFFFFSCGLAIFIIYLCEQALAKWNFGFSIAFATTISQKKSAQKHNERKKEIRAERSGCMHAFSCINMKKALDLNMFIVYHAFCMLDTFLVTHVLF